MSSNATWKRLALVCAVSLPLSAANAQLVADAHESPPHIEVDKVFPETLMQSGSHRVEDNVRIKGTLLEFTIVSDHGIYDVLSGERCVPTRQPAARRAPALYRLRRQQHSGRHLPLAAAVRWRCEPLSQQQRRPYHRGAGEEIASRRSRGRRAEKQRQSLREHASRRPDTRVI